MVEQATKEEADPLDAHGGESGDNKVAQGGKLFNKMNSKGSHADKKTKSLPELLKGVNFSISRDWVSMCVLHTRMDHMYRCA